jgi:hypothetical protein
LSLRRTITLPCGVNSVDLKTELYTGRDISMEYDDEQLAKIGLGRA